LPHPDFALASYDYDLPAELVAQAPLPTRDASRLLILDRASGALAHHAFADLPGLLRPGDLLVTNRSRVFPARLAGRRPRGGRAEILLVRRRSDGGWDAMLRPGRRLRAGTLVDIGPGLRARIEDEPKHSRPAAAGPSGHEAAGTPEGLAPESVLRRVQLLADGLDVSAALERFGHTPLPPYIRREDGAADRERYQTVYAREPGSVAAPTAGLHFDHALLTALRDGGVATAFITLHVGAGTFQPVRDSDPTRHRMHPERFRVPDETVEAVANARAGGGRVVAVGSTALRALEAAAQDDTLRAADSETDLFILPGYRFRVADCLITNFHLPRSTLFMLVAAFAGLDRMRRAYAHAIERRYRFFSYGDAMLLARAA
jgi:S-adenosylmethionine:tRNA ribosyltransferase-isomerase